jgi:hypothetical protein
MCFLYTHPENMPTVPLLILMRSIQASVQFSLMDHTQKSRTFFPRPCVRVLGLVALIHGTSVANGTTGTIVCMLKACVCTYG